MKLWKYFTNYTEIVYLVAYLFFLLDCGIDGYAFEFVPTPLSAGGVGMYINEELDYTVLVKTSEEAFQAL